MSEIWLARRLDRSVELACALDEQNPGTKVDCQVPTISRPQRLGGIRPWTSSDWDITGG